MTQTEEQRPRTPVATGTRREEDTPTVQAVAYKVVATKSVHFTRYVRHDPAQAGASSAAATEAHQEAPVVPSTVYAE